METQRAEFRRNTSCQRAEEPPRAGCRCDSRRLTPGDTYVRDDPTLPLLVFGPLGLVEPGVSVRVDDFMVSVARPSGLILEKLLTDRTHEKGDRDLLVVLAMLLVVDQSAIAELEREFMRLSSELRHAVLSNLTILSLMDPRPGMPDPRPSRAIISSLLRRFSERREDES